MPVGRDGLNPNATPEERRAQLYREEAERREREEQERKEQEWQETYGALLPRAPVVERELVLGADNPERLFQEDQRDQMLNQGKYYDPNNTIPDNTTAMFYRPPEEYKAPFDASMGGEDYSEGYWRAYGVLDPVTKRNADGYLISNREKDWSQHTDYLSQNEYDTIQSDLDEGYVVLAPNTLDADYQVTGKPLVQFGEGLSSADRIINVRMGYEELIEGLTGTDYKNANSFSGAKELADSAYIQTLRNEQSNYKKSSSEYKDIQKLINKGALDFNKESDYKLITENKFALEAARAQAFVMKDFIHRADPSLRTSNSINPLKPIEEIQFQETYLNTGTAAHFLDENNDGSAMYRAVKSADEWVSGDFGKYNAYGYVEPDTEWYEDLAQIAGIFGSIAFPQFAPLISAGSTIIQGGDIGDIAEGVIKGKVLSAVSAPILDEFGGTISDLPDPVQNVLLDTAEAVIGGESGTDALKDAALGEVLDAGEELLSEADLPDFDTPQIIKDIGDVAQELLEGPADLIAGAFEPAVDIFDDVADAIGDSAPVEAIEGVGKEVIEVAEDIGGDVVDFVDENIIEPIGDSDIVEAIEEGGKAVGEVGQDIIDTGSDVLSEVEDGLKEVGRGIDDIVDWESLLKRMVGIGGMGGTGGMMSAARQPTQVEGLFDKELFKFDTEIKSTQQILSPMNRKQRYG